jgi:hypothetical protein
MTMLNWQNTPTQLLRGQALEIPINSPKLKSNERIKVWLSDAQHTSSCHANLNNGKLVISQLDLKPFQGEVTVEISLEYEEKLLSAGSEGGSCKMTYEYQPFIVEIK